MAGFHIALLDPRQRGDEATLSSCETALAVSVAHIHSQCNPPPTFFFFFASPAMQTAQWSR